MLSFDVASERDGATLDVVGGLARLIPLSKPPAAFSHTRQSQRDVA